jgi:Ala-tRNA(Pro) deacylase
MAADRKTLFARLEELGIRTTTVEHAPMFTVEQSASLRESLPGAHTKNLFLVDKEGRMVLVVAKDDTRVDLRSRRQTRSSWWSMPRSWVLPRSIAIRSRTAPRPGS